MSRDLQSIVVGLGAVGAATLYQLARRGNRVLGIDQHRPPHALGSSHGESRITRLAIGEGEAYAPLVRRSHAIWRELEARTGSDILTTTGGLILAPRDGVAAHHGKPDFLRRTIECARHHGIDHEVLDTAAIRRRHPQFRLRGDEIGYWEPGAGVVRPEAAITAQLGLAESLGARVRTGEAVQAIEPAGTRLRVVTSGGRYTADQVVLAVGPWLPEFLGRPLGGAWASQFAVYRQVMYWFDAGPAAPEFAPGRFPVFIWMFGDAPEDYMYGFPATGPGAPAVKVATEQYVETTTPDAMQREVAPAEAEAMFSSRVAGRLHLPGGRCVDARACLYTVTPDRHFVIDTLPGLPGVHVASACSGHGFKHSAAVGEALAERLLGLAPTLDIEPFRQARPG